MAYTENIPEYGDVMTIKEFRESVECGAFTDYDGNGNPAKETGHTLLLDATVMVNPSRIADIPDDATHIVWYNR